MDTLVLTTLLFNTAGIAAISVAMALAYCLPARRRTRQWVAVDDAATMRSPVVFAQPATQGHEEEELARAA